MPAMRPQMVKIKKLPAIIHRIVVAGLLIFCISGCVLVPLPSRSSGPNFSKEALAFLDFRGTTRADVLESFGEPVIEIHDPGVLVYLCEVTPRTLVIPMDIDLGGQKTIENPEGKTTIMMGHPYVDRGPSEERTLFIAYDEHGYVFAHQIRMADLYALKSDCRAWRLSKLPK